MAEKMLNTRLKLRYDSHEKWIENDPVLLAGEVALSTISAKQDGTVNYVPSVLIKVGDGTHKYSELDFAYAKAADVLAACKSEDALKTFVNGVIADAGIASSSAMEALAGRVTTAEGEIDALQADLNTAETGLKARMTSAEGDIAALEGLVGEKNVATQISEAIAALNLANTYEAKGEAAKVSTALETYKTTNDAAVLANTNNIAANTNAITAIKDGTTIDSFADVESSLAGKETSGAAAQALIDAKAYADGLAGNYDAKGAAAQALTDAKAYAKDYADGLAVNYDAAGSAAQALEDAKDYTDAEIAEWVGDKSVSEQIAALDLENSYDAKGAAAAVEAKLNTHASEAAAAYETKTDAAAKLTEAKGYTDTEVAKVQGEVDALETYVGTIPEGYTEESVIAYINKKAEETLAAASGNSTETAASVKAALDTYKAENNAKVQANTDAIDAIEADYLKAADKAELQGAIDALEDLVGDQTVGAQISAVTDPLTARVKTIEDDYLKAADKTELQGNINTVSAAVERLTNGVSADEVDGVNDLIAYVNEHGTEVTGMKEDISENAAAIAAEKTRAEGVEGGLDTRLQAVEAAVGESGSVAGDIADALAEAKGYTDAEVKELADGAVATNAANIAALDQLVGDEAVATQISTAVAAEAAIARAAEEANASAIEALEEDSHTHDNKTVLDGITAGQVTAWDAAVQTVTAGTGLTATKTGTDVAIAFDDSVTFVFDCGDSSNV